MLQLARQKQYITACRNTAYYALRPLFQNGEKEKQDDLEKRQALQGIDSLYHSLAIGTLHK